MPVPGPGEPKSLKKIQFEDLGKLPLVGLLFSQGYDMEIETFRDMAEAAAAEQGETFDGNIGGTSLMRQGNSASSSSLGISVLDGSTGHSVYTSTPNLTAGAPHGMEEFADYDNGKIVCTTLIKSTGKQEWYNNRKLWNKHLNKHLTIYHQIGYYKLFKPFTDLMMKNKHVFRFGKWLAVSRTKDIEGIMNNKSRYIPGMLIRYIFESISFVIGYISVKIKG